MAGQPEADPVAAPRSTAAASGTARLVGIGARPTIGDQGGVAIAVAAGTSRGARQLSADHVKTRAVSGAAPASARPLTKNAGVPPTPEPAGGRQLGVDRVCAHAPLIELVAEPRRGRGRARPPAARPRRDRPRPWTANSRSCIGQKLALARRGQRRLRRQRAVILVEGQRPVHPAHLSPGSARSTCRSTVCIAVAVAAREVGELDDRDRRVGRPAGRGVAQRHRVDRVGVEAGTGDRDRRGERDGGDDQRDERMRRARSTSYRGRGRGAPRRKSE
jgi:hypothetical protein